ncbi:hypothetical protein V8C86DRAFT_3159604 [Haematococcus lacustris]
MKSPQEWRSATAVVAFFSARTHRNVYQMTHRNVGYPGSSLKKHKTQHKTKSAWVMEQLTAVTAPTSDPDETDGAVNFVLRYMCNHCQDNLAGSNKDRLKRHLLRCSKFLASTQAGNIAKTFSELAAAIEEYKQEDKEVAEVQQDAGTTPSSKSTARARSGVVEDKGRFAKDLVKLIVDCNLPFNIVDNPTFKTSLATWVPAMPVPSRDQRVGRTLHRVGRTLHRVCRTLHKHFVTWQASMNHSPGSKGNAAKWHLQMHTSIKLRGAQAGFIGHSRM